MAHVLSRQLKFVHGLSPVCLFVPLYKTLLSACLSVYVAPLLTGSSFKHVFLNDKDLKFGFFLQIVKCLLAELNLFVIKSYSLSFINTFLKQLLPITSLKPVLSHNHSRVQCYSPCAGIIKLLTKIINGLWTVFYAHYDRK